MLNVVKDVGQVGNREIILIGNREIKRQRICHDVKTANFNDREFKWGYSNITIRSTYIHVSLILCVHDMMYNIQKFSDVPPLMSMWVGASRQPYTFGDKFQKQILAHNCPMS